MLDLNKSELQCLIHALDSYERAYFWLEGAETTILRVKLRKVLETQSTPPRVFVDPFELPK